MMRTEKNAYTHTHHTHKELDDRLQQKKSPPPPLTATLKEEIGIESTPEIPNRERSRNQPIR